VFDETGDERIEVIEKGIATALNWVLAELGLGNVELPARILDPSLVRALPSQFGASCSRLS
jgi:hypothetical protein